MEALEKIKRLIKARLIYRNDFKNDKKYSTLLCGHRAQQEMLLSALVVNAHTIEKGLTMPNKRFPFGDAKAKTILNDCALYVKKGYDVNEPRFIDILAIMKEYCEEHIQHGVDVSAISKKVEDLIKATPHFGKSQQQYSVSRDEYFKYAADDFYTFANSRHSCRNLPGHVSEESLRKALSLSMTTPSTCNRQSQRVHVLQSTEAKKIILSIQGGHRGFGDIADQFLLVTSDLSCWPSGNLRNGPYVDGGIYLMNLLYSLHHEKIAACTLNMYLTNDDSRRMHQELGIPDNEVPIALIAIGIPPEQFDLARSHRRNYEEIITIH